jgi:hypothetical protein
LVLSLCGISKAAFMFFLPDLGSCNGMRLSMIWNKISIILEAFFLRATKQNISYNSHVVSSSTAKFQSNIHYGHGWALEIVLNASSGFSIRYLQSEIATRSC